MADPLPRRLNAFHQVGDAIEELIQTLQRAEPNFPEEWLLDVSAMRDVLTEYARLRWMVQSDGEEPTRLVTLFQSIGSKFSNEQILEHICKACGTDFEIGIITQVRALRTALQLNLDHATVVQRIVETLKVSSRKLEHADQ